MHFFQKPPWYPQVKYTHNYIKKSMFNFLGGKVLVSMCYFKIIYIRQLKSFSNADIPGNKPLR